MAELEDRRGEAVHTCDLISEHNFELQHYRTAHYFPGTRLLKRFQNP